MSEIKKKVLKQSADDFIIQSLTTTRSVSDLMITYFKQKKHSVWSLLPEDLDVDTILKFQYGYIHNHHPKLKDHVQLFKELMDGNEKNDWILIDNESESNDTLEENSIKKITKVFYYKETVFHLLPREQVSIDTLDITIRSAGWYPSIALISELSQQLRSKILNNTIEEDDIRAIINNIRYLIIGAYDEEGFLVVDFE